MDPQQELFSYFLTELRAAGYDVYDGALPPEGTPYPFIYMADSTSADIAVKGGAMGTVSQTVHIWHDNPKQRGTLSGMLLAVKKLARKLEETDFHWMVRNINQHILADTSTAQTLVHGVLEIDMRYS